MGWPMGAALWFAWLSLPLPITGMDRPTIGLLPLRSDSRTEIRSLKSLRGEEAVTDPYDDDDDGDARAEPFVRCLLMNLLTRCLPS